MDWEGVRNLSAATSVATAVANLADRLNGPKPALRVRVKASGGSNGIIDFTTQVSEVANKIPAFGVRVLAEIPGTDWRFESPPFNLTAGQIDHAVRIDVPRPKYGDLVHEANNHQTLYGRDLEIVVASEEGAYAIDTWHEDEYDPETDRGRYELMQKVWADGRALSE